MDQTTPRPPFVDVHTHVVPSGDDGATSIDEAIALCRAAHAAGTGTLFATPHMHAPFDQYVWSPARAELFARSLETLRPIVADLGVDLRRGREVFPTVVRDESPEELVLEGTTAILIEFPGAWLDIDDAVELTQEACEVVAAEGYVPVLAHPERCPAFARAPEQANRFTERGWLLCPNSGSFLGFHGPTAERVAWELLAADAVALVASDAHHSRRPPALDAAHSAITAQVGVDAATALFDGSALPWVEPRAEAGGATAPIRLG